LDRRFLSMVFSLLMVFVILSPLVHGEVDKEPLRENLTSEQKQKIGVIGLLLFLLLFGGFVGYFIAFARAERNEVRKLNDEKGTLFKQIREKDREIREAHEREKLLVGPEDEIRKSLEMQWDQELFLIEQKFEDVQAELIEQFSSEMVAILNENNEDLHEKDLIILDLEESVRCSLHQITELNTRHVQEIADIEEEHEIIIEQHLRKLSLKDGIIKTIRDKLSKISEELCVANGLVAEERKKTKRMMRIHDEIIGFWTSLDPYIEIEKLANRKIRYFYRGGDTELGFLHKQDIIEIPAEVDLTNPNAKIIIGEDGGAYETYPGGFQLHTSVAHALREDIRQDNEIEKETKHSGALKDSCKDRPTATEEEVHGWCILKDNGLTYALISRITGRPVGTLKSRISQHRKIMEGSE